MQAVVDVDEAVKVHRGVDVRWHEHHTISDKRTLLLRQSDACMFVGKTKDGDGWVDGPGNTVLRT
jgi:hypothetical protein